MTLPDLKSLKKIHVIGVGGTLMGAFAAYLKRQGVHVTGSDQNIYPPMSDVLRDAGVQLYQGYKAENISSQKERPDLIIIGNVIGRDNPEARAAIDQGYNYSSLPEAMERLLLQKTRNLVVAGTHGKTTTSSMLAHVLRSTKKDPSFFIGGVSQDLPFSFHLASTDSGRLFVLEGDEYDTAFWDKVPKFNHYLPDDVILTSIEFDHADIYADLNAVIRAFEGLVYRVRTGGRMIACFDYPVVQELVKKSKVPVISYGTTRESGARFIPGRIRVDSQMTHFEVLDQGNAVDEIGIQLPGVHNVLNALSVWIECKELGIPLDQVRGGFKKFRGVKRRQEIRGEVGEVLVIDDFAHHPTAVRETLRALRAKYPARRLVAVFEPRSATSRRKIFQQDYVKAFSESDSIFIAPPYDQTKIASSDQFSSDLLVTDLQAKGKSAFLMTDIEQGVKQVAEFARPGDVVAVLSNGGFGGFIQKLMTELAT